jgi:mutator family transposase
MKCPSCPHCNSRKTVKYGWPRWLCRKCRKTFRRRRKDTRDRFAIDGYTKDRSTYERLGVRWKVHRATAYRRVQRALKRKRPLLERTKRNLHLCDGILILDGKHLRIQGKLWTLFVAWDRGLKKPVHFILRKGGEGDVPYWRLLVDLKRLGYPFKGFVSDGIISLKELLLELYPDLPHQRCTVHIFLAARAKVTKGRKVSERTKGFIELLRMILWSRTLIEAKRRTQKLWGLHGLTKSERRALEYVWTTLPQCFICREKRFRHLHLPRSSNAIENVIGQVEARLKTRRGIKSETSMELLVNELLLQVREQSINH